MTPEEFYKKLSQQDFELANTQEKQFGCYSELLVEWNQKINLTAITDEKNVYLKHFYGSIAPVLQGKVTNQVIHLLDIGAGAGLPDIPIKILCPDVNITITGSLNKRINFLNLLADELGLKGVHFCHERAEDFGQDRHSRASYDIVTARTVARLQVLTKLTIPLLEVGGQSITLKTFAAGEELADAKNAMTILFSRLIDSYHYELPNSDSHQIIILEKEKRAPNKYPRKIGMPDRRPL